MALFPFQIYGVELALNILKKVKELNLLGLSTSVSSKCTSLASRFWVVKSCILRKGDLSTNT